MEFLLQNDRSASQAKIRHGTKIPRTSLARVLNKLESKKLIIIEKEGKMVNIHLSNKIIA